MEPYHVWIWLKCYNFNFLQLQNGTAWSFYFYFLSFVVGVIFIEADYEASYDSMIYLFK